jgi:CAAX protease family protein
MYLSPGVPVMIIYWGGGQWLASRHQPADLALAAGFLFIAFPIELTRTLRASHRTAGGGRLSGIDFHLAAGWRHFLLRSLALMVASFLLLFLTMPLTAVLANGPFSFLPSFMSPGYNWTTLAQPRSWLLMTAVILIAINGLLIPWAEEVYYRGYLLSRTPGRRGVAVVCSAVLFAIEHLWQPQNWPLIAGLAVLLGVAMFRWRTIWITYAVHAFANTFGIVLLAAPLLSR